MGMIPLRTQSLKTFLVILRKDFMLIMLSLVNMKNLSCVLLEYNKIYYIALFSYWGEPERAPHKWCIESKSLHSDGTTYVRNSNFKCYGKQLYTLT